MANFINISGNNLQMVQGEGTVVTFDLQQQAGTIVGGSARFSGDSGVCTGNVSDTKVFVDVQWNGGPHGQYHGDLGLDGNLSGITFDLAHQGSQAIWHSKGVNFNLNMIQG
jgi:hypothetical protein